MQSRLIVKNFGPIDYVNLDLRNVNVFIGPQASGKSALAKLFTIFKAPRKFINNGNVEKNLKGFKESLEEYNVSSFLKDSTEIEFHSESHSLSYKDRKISFDPVLLKQIQQLEKVQTNVKSELGQIKKTILELRPVLGINYLEIIDILGGYSDEETPMDDEDPSVFDNINEDNFPEIIKTLKKTEVNITTHGVLYIPTERNFINVVRNSLANLLLNDVPIPKHILSLCVELEKVQTKNLDLSFLQQNLSYENVNGEERIFTDKSNSIKLTEAASGIQSVLPILKILLSHDPDSFQRAFVIEEPELNLSPNAQYKLIKLVESTRQSLFDGKSRTIHTYTTHSPYVLSALNNLLYSDRVKNKLIEKNRLINGDTEHFNFLPLDNPVSRIIRENISPDTFSAYQIKNGVAKDILNRQTGLIMENYIDDSSDEISDDFDALMNLMK